jgi:hypothetical protein
MPTRGAARDGNAQARSQLGREKGLLPCSGRGSWNASVDCGGGASFCRSWTRWLSLGRPPALPILETARTAFPLRRSATAGGRMPSGGRGDESSTARCGRLSLRQAAAQFLDCHETRATGAVSIRAVDSSPCDCRTGSSWSSECSWSRCNDRPVNVDLRVGASVSS